MNTVATLTTATTELWFKSSDPATPPTAERELLFFHPNAYVGGNYPAVGVSIADATAQNMAPLTGRIVFVVVDARGGPQSALNARGFDLDASLPGFDEKQWHHYAVVFSGTTQRVFVDGVELTSVLQRDGSQATSFSSAFGSGFVAIYGSPFLTLGSFARDSIRFAQGGLSDVRISNSARYSAPFTPNFRPAADANTVFLLPISENTGTISADQSGNALNVTWSGGFSWCGT